MSILRVSSAQAQVRDAQPVTIENATDHPVPVLIPAETRLCADPDCPTTTRREGDENPFQWTRTLSHSPTAGTNPNGDEDYTGSASFQVPEGQRLVIEYVSAEASFGIDLNSKGKNDTRVRHHEPVGGLKLATTVSGATARHVFPFVAQGKKLGSTSFPLVDNAFRFVASEQVRLYADSGSEVVVSFMTNRANGLGSLAWVDVSVSGYLVSVDP